MKNAFRHLNLVIFIYLLTVCSSEQWKQCYLETYHSIEIVFFITPIIYLLMKLKVTECRNFSVSLDWQNSSNSRRIEISVRRMFKFQIQNSTSYLSTQIWLFGSLFGENIKELANNILFLSSESISIFIMDHRGISNSKKLCETAKTISSCSKISNEFYGSDLSYYSTTNAAYDLLYLLLYNPSNTKVCLIIFNLPN